MSSKMACPRLVRPRLSLVCILLVLAAALGVVATASAQSNIVVTISDLGSLGGSSVATAINQQGQVAGFSEGSRKRWIHAFLWQNGHITDLGTLASQPHTQATGINDDGWIIGNSYTRQGQAYHAFLWQNGHMTDLGTLPGDTSSQAEGINNLGQIVGSSSGAGGTRSVLWENGSITALSGVGNPSFAVSINGNGQILGRGTNAQGNVFVWQNGRVKWINTTSLSLPVSSCNPEDINNHGDLALSCSVDGEDLAFGWFNGRMRPIGLCCGVPPASQAASIDQGGRIVGNNYNHAFL